MEIEEAKSGRSTCIGCRNIIQCGAMRLVTEDYDYGFNNKRYRCLKCGKHKVIVINNKLSCFVCDYLEK